MTMNQLLLHTTTEEMNFTDKAEGNKQVTNEYFINFMFHLYLIQK